MSESYDAEWLDTIREVDTLFDRINEREAARFQHRFNLTSAEKSLVDRSAILRKEMIKSQTHTLKLERAGRLTGWLLAKRKIMPVCLGFDDDHFPYISPEPTIETRPRKVESSLTGTQYGTWSFKLNSPVGGDSFGAYENDFDTACFTASRLEFIKHNRDRELNPEGGPRLVFAVDINNHDLTEYTPKHIRSEDWPEPIMTLFFNDLLGQVLKQKI